MLHYKILKKIMRIKQNEIYPYTYWSVMSIKNVFKFFFLRENYNVEWGAVQREHNYLTRTMENEPLFTPKSVNRFQNRTISFLMPRILNEMPVSLRKIELINFNEIKNFYLSKL